MIILQSLILGMLALASVGVVATRDPASQAIAISFYGLLLAVMFFLFQAPDVALAQLVIGAVALPLMMLLAIARMKRIDEDKKRSS